MEGLAPLETVFWRDMLLYGTLIALLTTIAAVVMAVNDAPDLAIVVDYLAALPYNLFIVTAVWRASEDAPAPQRGTVRLVAALWFVAALVL